MFKVQAARMDGNLKIQGSIGKHESGVKEK